MSKPPPRKLDVVRVATLTPNMKRITLGGPGLNDFPQGQESAYIKFMFPREDQTEQDILSGQVKPLLRSYTIRQQHIEPNEIDVDFAIHGDNGPASKWAMSAKAGDQAIISWPGPTKLVDFNANWFFMVGDMTALPAISVSLERLPPDARGYFVMEALTEKDIQPIDLPENMQAHWVINPHPDQPNSILVDKVKSLDFMQGRPFVWVACEFGGMRALRRYFKQEHKIAPDDIYISSYWKMGATDEQHKAAKREDTEAA